MSGTQRQSFENETLEALQQVVVSSSIPERSSSLGMKHNTRSNAGFSHRRNRSIGNQSQHQMTPGDIEKHVVSPHTDLVHRPRASYESNRSKGSPATSNTSQGYKSSTPRTPRHVAIAPSDPSPLNPLRHITSPDRTPADQTTSQTPAQPPPLARPTRMPPAPPTSSSPPTHDHDHDHGHNNHTQIRRKSVPASTQSNLNTIRHASERDNPNLPAGTLTTTHHTDVSESVLPPVTHEVIYRQTTEIIQKEITRDIHIHHYYTYIQPITAVEILPARHFLLDPDTGVKTEIAAPKGWVLPLDMRPSVPDMSGLVPVSRHYLVDEENPNGVDEPPPRDMRSSSAGFLTQIASASHRGMWEGARPQEKEESESEQVAKASSLPDRSVHR